MRNAKLIRHLFLVVVCAAVARAVWAEPLLKPGDRMVFLGDSITEQRIYTRYVMNYFALHYPGANITFRNAGWGGDQVRPALARLQRDVLSLRPTAVSVCFGMNDARYKAFTEKDYKVFVDGMSGIVSELKKAGVKIVLLTPGCVDVDNPVRTYLGGYNDTLAVYARGVCELAKRENLPVCDIHEIMLSAQTAAKARDPKFTMIPDGIHPSPPGQAIMAYGLLKALGCADHASGLEIDAAKAVALPGKCAVRNLKIARDSVRFARRDEALPAYFDPEASVIFPYVPGIQEMNAYRFKVTGLKAGKWRLVVQGVDVGEFSAEALSAGIDLSTSPGPWRALGEEVNRLSAEQEDLYYFRWREMGFAETPPVVKPEADGFIGRLDKLIASKETARIHAAARVRDWKWSLTFAK